MLVDDSIPPEQPKVYCQGNWCGHEAYAYIEANDVVVLLCEPCIVKVADACTILGIRWKVFDPHSGPLKPKDADTPDQMVSDPNQDGDLRLIKGRRQIYNGGSFELNPYHEQAAVACCDCGLVHILDLHLLDYSRTVRVTLRRDNELTARWRAYRDEQRGATATADAQEKAWPVIAAGSPSLEGTQDMERSDTGVPGRSAVAGPLEDSGDLD
jgi:hypothetical protein